VTYQATVESGVALPGAASPIAVYLESLLARHRDSDSGEVATYIPELAGVDPDLFGVCLATVDGAFYEAGDTSESFTIQSMSKPLMYGLALEVSGDEAVRRRVGVEPSGDPFNEISLRPGTGTPVNPMINAGAITCVGLLVEAVDDPVGRLLDTFSAYAGRRLDFDEAVYRSEADTGHRNRGIAHLLRSFDVILDDPEAALDLYFRQCSIAVDCRDLAMIAATLANGGVNPVTGVRAVSEGVVQNVLSVMTTCGMYDGAGNWLVSVGLPAKSGVSGGVFGVLPGRLGVAVFSPRLDEQGNSTRGVAVCEDLSRGLALHLVRPGERMAPSIRTSYSLAERASKRMRSDETRARIRAAAERTAVFELQGELGFVAAEAVSRCLLEAEQPAELVVIDLRRVLRSDQAGRDLLPALGGFLHAAGGRLAVSGHGLEDYLDDSEVLQFMELDLALEWCEDELLERLGAREEATGISVSEHSLLDGLTAGERARLFPLLEETTMREGTTLMRAGDPANELFLVTDGRLSVFAPGGQHRLTTLSAGMTFGELAYIERGLRSADVVADSHVTCSTLSYAVLDELATTDPVLYGTLLRNILGVVGSSLRLANAGLAHFTR
jgi:glutaminase